MSQRTSQDKAPFKQGHSMEFSSCDSYTLGVEWELQLLDRDTLDLYPGIVPVLDSFPGNPYLKPEFIQSCVELNSPISADSSQIRTHFLALTLEVLRHCHALNMDVVGAGTHPFCRRLALVTPLPRYKKMASEHGYIGQTQLAFSNHVHVGLPSGNDALRVMRRLTPCLPLLIAIAANSPFWRGHDTGYASYRRRLLAVARSYGIPPYFEDWSAFTNFFEMARRAKSIRTIKDIHWDIRPHPDFGTLEFRVMDSASTVENVVFLAGLVRVLVAWAHTSSLDALEAVAPRHLTAWIERENHFRASHWGMQADVIHDEYGTTRPIVHYLQDLAGAIAVTANEIGESLIPAQLACIATATPAYEEQRRVYEAHNDSRAVVADMQERLQAEVGHHAQDIEREQ